MNVRPRPHITRGREDALVGDRNERQWMAGEVFRLGEFRFLHHDQRNPGQQLQALGGRWSVAPAEVFVVEIACRQVIRFEVRDELARLGADNDARIDANDVTRPIEFDRLCDRLG